jgi:broad specificity phosphatase PhoE
MEIILMRHYKVDIQFEEKYTSQTFDKVCHLYNEKPVLWQEAPNLPDYKLYASQMIRAQQTAQMAFNREFEILEGVHEVTMKSYKDSPKLKPRWWWELMGRIQWRFNSNRPNETYTQTMKRLDQALALLIHKDENVIVVMHGLAMRYMVKCLRAHGFIGPRIWHAKNGECFRYIKRGD